MKKQSVSRLLAVLLTLAMLLSMVPAVFAAEPGKTELEYKQVSNDVVTTSPENKIPEDLQSNNRYEETDEVRVSIVLEKAAPIELFSADDLDDTNGQVDSYRKELLAEQKRIEDAISSQVLGGQPLDVVWNLTLAANLISANVQYGQIAAIRQVDGVESVHLEVRHELDVTAKGSQCDPNMKIATDMVGTSTAWESGYTGAGMRIAIIDTGLDLEHQSFTASGYLYSMSERAAAAGMELDAYLGEQGVDILDQAEIEAVFPKLNVAQIYADNETADGPLTAADVYHDEKVPFIFNYIDKDLNVSHELDEQSEHGSHVAGISAANKYIPNGEGFDKALDTVFVQGNAPDAQLIILKVFGVNGAPFESDYLASIEDAIVLGCDTINMSLGSPMAGMTTAEPDLQLVLDRLEETDTVVAISAGNSGSFMANSISGLPYPYANEIQYHTGGSPGTYTNSLCVASVDNDGSIGYKLNIAGSDYDFTESTGKNSKPIVSLDTSADGTGTQLDYVLLDGFGIATDYASLDVQGKVVLCSRGSTSFGDKAKLADEKGAAALIVYNNQPGVIRMDLADFAGEMPCVSITQDAAAAIKAASEFHEAASFLSSPYYTGAMTVSNALSVNLSDSEFKTMSVFSSWGVPGDLSMKPEITAPGGNIFSANGLHGENGQILGGHDQYELMSGTSMAAPQIAGIAALVTQYIETNQLQQPGLTNRALAQSILMSTATPLLESKDNYYPVLRQGAGLVNTAAATSADSYILVDGMPDGKVKVELLDDPQRTGSYDFGFTIHNLDGLEHSYDLSSSVFTQAVAAIDGLPDYCMDDLTMPVAADVTYTVNGAAASSVTVPADGSAHVQVSMVLDQAEKEEILQYFTNGFYVEAFVKIDAAAPTEEGVQSTSHSIPVLGFCGCWTDPSMFDYGSFPYYRSGEYYLPPHMMPMDEDGLAKNNVLSVVYHDREGSFYYGGNPFVADTEYLPERNAFNSVNGDEIFGWIYSVIRNASAGVMRVSPVEGSESFTPIARQVTPENLMAGFYHPSVEGWLAPYYLEPLVWHGEDGNGDPLPENTMAELSITLAPELYGTDPAAIRWDELGEGATLSTLITIDNTAPEMLGKPVLDGTTLTVTAKDNQYIAAAALYDATGTRALTYSNPNQKDKGAEIEVSLDLTGIVGKRFYVQVMDYAANAATYEVYYENEFAPDVDSYYNIYNQMDQTWYGLDTTGEASPISYAAQNIVAAEKVDDMVFAFDNEQNYSKLANFYVMPADDPGDITKVSTFYNPTEDGARYNVGDMAYNYIDHTMYMLYYVQDTDADQPYLATVELSTGKVNTLGRLPMDARGLAIDNAGNCYTIGVISRKDPDASIFFPVYRADYMLYTFTPDTFTAPKLVSETPVVKNVPSEVSLWTVSLTWDANRSTVVMADCQATYMNLFGLYSAKCVALREINPATAETTTIKVYDAGEGKGQTPIISAGLFVNQPNYDFHEPQGSDLANAQALMDHVTGVRPIINEDELKDINGDGKVTSYDVYLLLRIQDNPTHDDFGTTDVPTDVLLSYNDMTMIIGTRSKLDASVVPWNLSNRDVIWSSDDETIVSVDQQGNLLANKLGTCTITAVSALDPKVFGTCTVTVDTIHADLTALVETETGSNWVDFDTGNPGDLSKVTGSPAASLYAAAANGSTVYGTTLDEAPAGFTSTLYRIDTAAGTETEVGPILLDDTPLFVTGLAYAPNVFLNGLTDPSQGALLGLYFNYILFIDPANGNVVNLMDYGTDTNVFVGITNSGSLLDPTYNIRLDEILLVDTNGQLFKTAYGTVDGELGWYQESVNDDGAFVMDIGYTVGENLLYNALCYTTARNGEHYLFWDYFDGTGSSLISIDYDHSHNVYLQGEFPADTGVTAMVPGSAFPDDTVRMAEGELTIGKAEPLPDGEALLASVTDPADIPANAGLFGADEPEAAEPENPVPHFVLRKTNAGPAILNVYPTAPITNGLVKITYDTARLKYVGTDCDYLNSVNNKEAGTLILGFADCDPAAAEHTVFRITFTPKTDAGATTVTMTTLESNQGEPNAETFISFMWDTTKPDAGGGEQGGQGGSDADAEKPEAPDISDHGFVDVPRDAWYHDDVVDVVEQGLMSGVSATEFAPNLSLTRAMLVTILHRAAGTPDAPANGKFTDVPADSWYTDAVNWASSEGIVNGLSETTFGPDQKITRQEFVTMLWRYAKANGYDVSAAGVVLPNFVDRDQIADWARDAVSWAYAKGIISGRPGNCLDPKGNASRAEAAAMLNRFTRLSPDTVTE